MAEKTGRVAVVVLGMHRSGTSLLSRAISLLGPRQPSDPVPKQPDNPDGFGEPLGVVRFNDRVLAELSSSWDRPGPWYLDARPPAKGRARIHDWLTRTHVEAAAAVLEQSFPDAGDDFVLKDPRLCLFVPMWRAALDRLDTSAGFVPIVRHPLAVARSLANRNAMPQQQALLLWQTYVLSVLEAAPTIDLVDFDDLLRRPTEILTAIADRLGLDAPDDLASKVRTLISTDLVHHRGDETALDDDPLVAPLVRDTWALVGDWNGLPVRQRRATVKAIREKFDDALLLVGEGRFVSVTKVAKKVAVSTPARPITVSTTPSEPLAGDASTPDRDAGPMTTGDTAARRFVVLHYHLFKNAGSSLDEMFRRNVGKAWHEQEFAAPGGRTNAAAVSDWIESHPEVTVLSSHTALMPVPRIADVEVLPVLFVRHPLLRLRSAYSFERRQQAETFGSKLAKRETFAGYISTLLDTKNHRQARNFQTFRLAYGTPEGGTEASRARRTMRSLPFIGLVEAYDASLERLEALIRPHVPDFTAVSVRKNVTTERPEMKIADQLAELREELGNALYDRLAAENAEDIALVDLIRAQYQKDGE